MKIAMLQADIPPVGPGGVGYQVDLLASELTRRGHDVTVFAAHPEPGGTAYEVKEVVLAGHGRLQRQFGVGRAFAALDLTEFDVVHAHGDDWLFGRARPRVRTYYGTALMEARNATMWLRRSSQLAYYALEWASGLGSHAVAISESTRRYLPFIRECIPCAFDPTHFFPGTPGPEPTILFVAGTLKGRKRGSLLLQAFDEVHRGRPEVRLSIVSRDYVAASGVDCYSDISASRLGELYRSSWLLCSTSSYEGFGVPYLEAMASGLPVVTTPNEGATEVLDHGRFGIIAEPAQLANTLSRLLDSEEERRRLSAAGLIRAKRFTIDVIASTYERVYEAQRANSPRP